MNVLIFSSALIGFSEETRGGPSIWCENLIRFLSSKGHNVFALAIGRLKNERKIEPFFREILYDCRNPLKSLSLFEPFVFAKMAESLFAARKAAKICRTQEIDVIIGTGVHECAGLYLVGPPAPLIISIRGDYTKEILFWLSDDTHLERHLRMYKIMEFMSLNASTCVTFVSNWLKNRLSSIAVPEKRFVIPNPLRMKSSAGLNDHIQPLKIPQGKKIIISISSFHSQHRVDGLRILAKAADIIASHNLNVHFVILGGSQNQKYFNEVNNFTSKLPITLAGYREDVINILAKGDLYLHCSVLDSFSNAMLEAMSVGLPCVSTKVGGIPEIISDRVDGILTDLDPKSVARAVVEVLEKEEFARSLGQAARKKVSEKYTWQVIGPQWETILEGTAKD
jgi:glycosyltransferase involved in cell wall biosynthesis